MKLSTLARALSMAAFISLSSSATMTMSGALLEQAKPARSRNDSRRRVDGMAILVMAAAGQKRRLRMAGLLKFLETPVIVPAAAGQCKRAGLCSRSRRLSSSSPNLQSALARKAAIEKIAYAPALLAPIVSGECDRSKEGRSCLPAECPA